MKRFEILAGRDWEKLIPGKSVIFPDNTRNGRRVTFQINATKHLEVWGQSPEGDATLLAASDGLFEVVASSRGPLEVWVEGKHCVAFMKTNVRDYSVEARNFEKHTEIEMRQSVAPEIQAMMRTMKLNELRRNQKLDTEVSQIKETLRAQLKTNNGRESASDTISALKAELAESLANASKSDAVIEPGTEGD